MGPPALERRLTPHLYRGSFTDMRWRVWWVLGWLWAVLLVLFAGHARAQQVNYVAIHVCVRPPTVPVTVEAWTFVNDANSYTVRIPPKDFTKQANGLPIYVYDPFAPPDSVKLYPVKFNKLVCPPPPQLPKPPEAEKKEEQEKDKKASTPSGGVALPAPPAEEEKKKAPEKKADPDEPPPGVIRLIAPPPPEDVHSLPPKGGVTESWPSSVLPFKASPPETMVLPTVKVCGGGVLPFKGAACHKDEEETVAKGGDPTKKGKGEAKTAFEKFAESIALGGGLLNLQLGEDIHDKDGSKYGVPGGKNKDGIQSATAQAVAGSLMLAAVVISAGGFDKKVYEALAKGTPILLRGGGKVAEDAAEKLIQDAIAKHGQHAVEDLAAALAKNGAIGEYSVMAKFTKGLGARWQAHHILEVAIAKDLKIMATDRLPAVILSEAEHKAMTKRLAALTRDTEGVEELWAAYQKAYKEHPTWLAAIRKYFEK